MPTPPIYAEHTAPGRADSLLRYIANQDTGPWTAGHVEASTGWFMTTMIDSTDIAEYASEFGDPWITEQHNFEPGYYMIQINNDGLIWGHYYGPPNIGHQWDNIPRRRMLADFNRMVRLFREWCGPDEGDSDFES